MKFFFDELINFQKIDIKNKTTFLNIFNKKSGIKKRIPQINAFLFIKKEQAYTK